MNATTQKRCEQLSAEANKIAGRWIENFANNYGGKVRFVLALATAVSIIRDMTPGLENTGQDFISAVKDGTVLWVESGEPIWAEVPKYEQHSNRLCGDATALGEGCPTDNCNCTCHVEVGEPTRIGGAA